MLLSTCDETADGFSPEGVEPFVQLAPMTAGREVVEDRTTQFPLHTHPMSSLREELTAAAYDHARTSPTSGTDCTSTWRARSSSGRSPAAPRPLLIVIEDETGVDQGILCPDRFEARCRTVMSATMVSAYRQMR